MKLSNESLCFVKVIYNMFIFIEYKSLWWKEATMYLCSRYIQTGNLHPEYKVLQITEKKVHT